MDIKTHLGKKGQKTIHMQGTFINKKECDYLQIRMS